MDENKNQMQYYYEELLKTEQIPDAYQRWEEYRLSVTEYIMAKLHPMEHIAILGAGALNDIELRTLLDLGVQIDLLDYDVHAVMQGVQNQLGSRWVEYHSKEQLRVMDYDVWPVGIAFYHEVERLFLAQSPIKVVIDALKDLTNQIEKEEMAPMEQYDTMICMGLHSQVMVHFVALLQYYVREGKVLYDEASITQFQSQIADMNDCMVKRLQEHLLKHCKRMILSYEYATFDTEDENLYEVLDLLYQGNMAAVEQCSLSRVQGALQLEQWLGQQFYHGAIQILQNAYAVWPFSKDKQYLMALYEITKD